MQPEHLRTFQDAQSAFDAEDYRLSATLYQHLLDEGVRLGAVYYNLGNAYAKSGEPVRAVAAYYFAKRYIPRDPYLNANLRAVLLENGGSLPPVDGSLTDSIFFWQESVGYSTKIWTSLTLTALTFLGGLFCLFLPRKPTTASPQAKWLKRCSLVSAMCSAIALVSVGYDWYRFDGVDRAIVTTNAIPRKGNSEQYEPAFVSPVPFGTQAIILDERGDWYFLRFLNGQEGWLPHSQTFRLVCS